MASQFKSVMVTIDGQKMMDIPVIVFSWVVAIPGKTNRRAEIPGTIIPGKNDSVAAIPGKKPG